MRAVESIDQDYALLQGAAGPNAKEEMSAAGCQ